MHIVLKLGGTPYGAPILLHQNYTTIIHIIILYIF